MVGISHYFQKVKNSYSKEICLYLRRKVVNRSRLIYDFYVEILTGTLKSLRGMLKNKAGKVNILTDEQF